MNHCLFAIIVYIVLAALTPTCDAHDSANFCPEDVTDDDVALLMQNRVEVPVLGRFSEAANSSNALVASTKEGPAGRAPTGARQQHAAVGLQQILKQIMLSKFSSYSHSRFSMSILLGIIAFVLLLVIVRNCLGSSHEADKTREESAAPRSEELPTLALFALVLPEAFHGFFLATFMPYVLVKQGPEMTNSSALFMGTAKVVFAVSVAFMPAMGIWSDWLVFRSSYVAGRCNALIIGSLLTAAGLYGCVISTEDHRFALYYIAVFLMRIGTDMFNVVTEGLLLDLVPEKQYDAACGMKGAVFFLGTALTYLMLVGEIYYKSLYYLYLALVFLAVLPGTLVVAKYKPLRQSMSIGDMQTQSMWALLWKAYHGPCTMKTYFPTVALSTFLFHVGMPPLYMNLLWLQDLIPISDEIALRHNWCASSFLALLGAAVFSTLFGLQPGQKVEKQPKEATMDHHVTLLRRWMWAVVIVLAYYPFSGLFSYTVSRIQLYVLGVLSMSSYAVTKAFYQELAWLSVPDGMSSANLMAFFVTCIVLGLGIGSLISGCILDIWAKDSHSYSVPGYFAMNCFSVFSCLAALAVL